MARRNRTILRTIYSVACRELVAHNSDSEALTLVSRVAMLASRSGRRVRGGPPRRSSFSAATRTFPYARRDDPAARIVAMTNCAVRHGSARG